MLYYLVRYVERQVDFTQRVVDAGAVGLLKYLVLKENKYD